MQLVNLSWVHTEYPLNVSIGDRKPGVHGHNSVYTTYTQRIDNHDLFRFRCLTKRWSRHDFYTRARAPRSTA